MGGATPPISYMPSRHARASFTLFYARINDTSIVDKASHTLLFQDTFEQKKKNVKCNCLNRPFYPRGYLYMVVTDCLYSS